MIAAGFGFRLEVGIDSLLEIYSDLCKTYLGGSHVDVFSTHENKSKAEALVELSQLTGIATINFTDAELAAQNTINYSDLSMRIYNTGSLAEASALAAAGSNSLLLGGRVISRDRLATCAFAKGDKA
tara:strand:+ start:260 stop:640 length:381 start_codon:yes stop_codon:yes gene_type:complete